MVAKQTDSIHQLTVIIPLYNEEENIAQLGIELEKFISESHIPAAILFINDGSTDGGQVLIEKLCKVSEHYHFIKLKENRGLSAAIKAGIDHCQTDLVGYIDADLQTHPLEFIKFYEFVNEFDLINGIRAKRKDTIVKKLSSKIANSFRRFMINDGIQDTGCPLKIMKTSVAKKIPFFDGMHRFIPALVQLQGGKVKQIPVNHYPRFAGTAKYHLWNRIRKPFIDTFAFRWMKSRYINYEVEKRG